MGEILFFNPGGCLGAQTGAVGKSDGFGESILMWPGLGRDTREGLIRTRWFTSGRPDQILDPVKTFLLQRWSTDLKN